MDELELRGALEIATREALEIGDALATEVVGSPAIVNRCLTLAIDFNEKVREIRRLRCILKVEFGG